MSTTALNDGQWHHVAVVLEGSSSEDIQLYVDGLQQEVSRSGHAVSINTAKAQPVEIGKNEDATFFSGKLKEVRIWNKALTEQDIRLHKDVSLVGNEKGLVTYLPMNELGGEVAYDQARNYDANFQAKWEVSNAGKAYRLNGNALSVAEAFALEASDDFTVSLWFKGSEAATLLSNTIDSEEEEGWKVTLNENGRLIVTSGDNELLLSTVGNMTDNAWHQFSMVQDVADAMHFYVDGEKVNSNIDLSLSLNGQLSFGEGFVGSLDEIRVWRTARTPEQLSADMHYKLKGDELGLLAYYPFENGTEASLEDLSNHAYHLEGGEATNLLTSDAVIAMKNPKRTLNVDYVVVEDQLLIGVSGQAEYLEGSVIDVTVDGMKDVNGNTQRSAVTWSAEIVQNQLFWKDDVLDKELYLAAGERSFQATLVNLGDEEEFYTIDGLPTWLNVAENEGTIREAFQKTLTFEIGSDVVAGRYTANLEVIGNAGVVQTLPLSIEVTGEAPAVLDQLTLAPNPFTDEIDFRLELKKDAEVKVYIHDLTGQLIRTFDAETMKAGYHEVTWDGTNNTGNSVAQGVYLVEVITNGQRQVQRVMKQ